MKHGITKKPLMHSTFVLLRCCITVNCTQLLCTNH